MGMSANQARFLSLTSRQVDLEYRMQQICHRRLRLASELEKVATKYNNKISDRKLYLNTLNTTAAVGPMGYYEEINIPQLAENNLYVLGPSGPAGVNITYSWQSAGTGSDAPSSIDNTADHFVGEQVTTGTTRITYTSNVKTVITPAAPAGVNDVPITYLAPADFSTPSTNPTIAGLTVNGTDLEWVEHQTYEKQADGTYAAQTITSLAINTEAGLTSVNAAMAAGNGLDANYILMADIDLSSPGATWDCFNQTFTGIFDGNGHTISNFTTAGDGSYPQGFFSRTNGASLKNLTLSNVDVSNNDQTTWKGAAALVGNASNTKVTNVEASGTVEGYGCDGGILGYTTSCTLDNVRADVDVSNLRTTASSAGQGQTGGLVGWGTDLIINRSFSEGDVLGPNDTGGLVGIILGASQINNSYTTGTVTTNSTTEETAGVVGNLSGGVVTNCYASGVQVNSGSSQTGWISGNDGTTTHNGTDIIHCFYSASDGTGNTSTEINNAIANWDTDVWLFSGEPGYVAPDTLNSPIIDPTAMGSIQVNTPAQAEVAEWVWHYDVEQEIETVSYDAGGYSPEELEAGLRSGELCLAKHADQFSQEIETYDGVDYEKVDWRTQPVINDDLYAANDVDAESEYDSAIEKINSQDKKLQLEQSQIEVEHKAIVTQKDAVKNILNKNIESSFKTFS